MTYADGSKENIKEALASGRISTFDMSQEGIGCFVRDKTLTDASERELFRWNERIDSTSARSRKNYYRQFV